jgi:hypothetical protein
MFVLQLHSEHRIRQRFEDHGHYLNRVFFAQSILNVGYRYSVIGTQ